MSTPWAIMCTTFKVKRQRSTSPDQRVRRPVLPTSAITTKVKGEGRDVTWCVRQMLAHKSRMKNPRNTQIGRKVAYRTDYNAHHFQGQRSRSPGRLMLKQKARHIFRTERRTNLKLSTLIEDENPHHLQASTMTSKVKGQGRKVT